MARAAPDDVTVVIAVRNGGAGLVRTVARYAEPVIVVDNASDDGGPDLVEREFPQVRVVRLSRNIGAAARNVGVSLAPTPFVAFADDDSCWLGDSLAEAAAILRRHPAAGLLTATVLVGPSLRTDPVSAAMAAAPLGAPAGAPGPAVLGFLACAAVVRRDAFLGVGGFEPHLHIYGEEDLVAMDLAAAGWHLSYVPTLAVHHQPGPAGRDVAGRRQVEARNRLLTAVLRRPAGVVARTARQLGRDPDERAGVRAAVGHLPWALRHRRRLPPSVERARSLLDAIPFS